MKKLAIIISLFLVGCSTPTLPDATIVLPEPPAELMAPPGKMIPIPTETNTVDPE
jgi:hypothetical protein